MQTSAAPGNPTCPAALPLTDDCGVPMAARPTSERTWLVTLVDGTELNIASLSAEQLRQVQCEQEPAFAQAISAAPKDSALRQQVTRQAYTTICAVLEQLSQRQQKSADFRMGMDDRYSDLILRLLRQQARRGVSGGLFEVGFCSGVLLERVAAAGYPVGGLEVVDDLLAQAKRKLAKEHHPSLLLGDFRKQDFTAHRGRYSMVYWNDVFEHIPQDEILDYLKIIYSLLGDGGILVTITPNWHMRPSDVTTQFSPPRTAAVGFHLKEYKLAEVCALTRQAGFRAVRTPAFISRHRIYDLQWVSGSRTKALLEPMLEWLPFPVAVQACRRLGFNLTIATK
ncbi:MAG: class I SAM-dependent methyltransferase [Planctomycetales bacterium]|nr:class I SAM-dependent methyltransferase [Planctomycetales bacterium]